MKPAYEKQWQETRLLVLQGKLKPYQAKAILELMADAWAELELKKLESFKKLWQRQPIDPFLKSLESEGAESKNED